MAILAFRYGWIRLVAPFHLCSAFLHGTKVTVPEKGEISIPFSNYWKFWECTIEPPLILVSSLGLPEVAKECDYLKVRASGAQPCRWSSHPNSEDVLLCGRVTWKMGRQPHCSFPNTADVCYQQLQEGRDFRD